MNNGDFDTSGLVEEGIVDQHGHDGHPVHVVRDGLGALNPALHPPSPLGGLEVMAGVEELEDPTCARHSGLHY